MLLPSAPEGGGSSSAAAVAAGSRRHAGAAAGAGPAAAIPGRYSLELESQQQEQHTGAGAGELVRVQVDRRFFPLQQQRQQQAAAAVGPAAVADAEAATRREERSSTLCVALALSVVLIILLFNLDAVVDSSSQTSAAARSSSASAGHRSASGVLSGLDNGADHGGPADTNPLTSYLLQLERRERQEQQEQQRQRAFIGLDRSKRYSLRFKSEFYFFVFNPHSPLSPAGDDAAAAAAASQNGNTSSEGGGGGISHSSSSEGNIPAADAREPADASWRHHMPRFSPAMSPAAEADSEDSAAAAEASFPFPLSSRGLSLLTSGAANIYLYTARTVFQSVRLALLRIHLSVSAALSPGTKSALVPSSPMLAVLPAPLSLLSPLWAPFIDRDFYLTGIDMRDMRKALFQGVSPFRRLPITKGLASNEALLQSDTNNSAAADSRPMWCTYTASLQLNFEPGLGKSAREVDDAVAAEFFYRANRNSQPAMDAIALADMAAAAEAEDIGAPATGGGVSHRHRRLSAAGDSGAAVIYNAAAKATTKSFSDFLEDHGAENAAALAEKRNSSGNADKTSSSTSSTGKLEEGGQNGALVEERLERSSSNEDSTDCGCNSCESFSRCSEARPGASAAETPQPLRAGSSRDNRRRSGNSADFAEIGMESREIENSAGTEKAMESRRSGVLLGNRSIVPINASAAELPVAVDGGAATSTSLSETGRAAAPAAAEERSAAVSKENLGNAASDSRKFSEEKLVSRHQLLLRENSSSTTGEEPRKLLFPVSDKSVSSSLQQHYSRVQLGTNNSVLSGDFIAPVAVAAGSTGEKEDEATRAEAGRRITAIAARRASSVEDSLLDRAEALGLLPSEEEESAASEEFYSAAGLSSDTSAAHAAESSKRSRVFFPAGQRQQQQQQQEDESTSGWLWGTGSTRGTDNRGSSHNSRLRIRHSAGRDDSTNSSPLFNRRPYHHRRRRREPDIVGELVSTDCGFYIFLRGWEVDYVALASHVTSLTLVFNVKTLLEMRLFWKQMQHTESIGGLGSAASQALLLRVSLLGVAWQAAVDVFEAVAILKVAMQLQIMMPYFFILIMFKFILFGAFEVRYLLVIWNARQQQRRTAAETVRRSLTHFYRTFYGSLAILIFLVYYFFPICPPLCVILYFLWIPQIAWDVWKGQRNSMDIQFVVGMSLCRVIFPAYLFGCPVNLFVDAFFASPLPNYGMLVFILLVVGSQVALILAQRRFGSRFFVPLDWLPHVYNYHRALPACIEMDAEGGLPECAICMNSIDAKSKHRSITPCDHLFHDKCLQQWMEVKMECPNCRGILPPFP